MELADDDQDLADFLATPLFVDEDGNAYYPRFPNGVPDGPVPWHWREPWVRHYLRAWLFRCRWRNRTRRFVGLPEK